MRFLVDECLPQRLTPRIAAAGHDAVHVIAAGRRGMRDRDVWAWAAAEGRMLVTADKGFPRSERPAPPGLVLLRLPSSYTGPQIAAVFESFIAEGGLDRAEGHIVVLEVSRVRVRPFDGR